MQITAVLIQAKEGGYVAYNPETGTTSQGDNLDGGLASLREAAELYPEELRDEA
jgi:predicted RNase H-like HicB family nuclease